MDSQQTITTKKQKTQKEQSYRSKLKEFPPKFSEFFVGKEYLIVRHLMYDPDTVNGVIIIEGKEVTFPFRLLGFDAIEKKQKQSDVAHLSEEDASLFLSKYKESEQLLHQLIDGKELTVKCDKLDLYGRILSTIYVQDENGEQVNVNQKMIDSRTVFVYAGGTKLTVDEQIAFLKSQ